MNKKNKFLMLLFIFTCPILSNVRAVSISDIPAIVDGVRQLYEDVTEFNKFASSLGFLNNNSFVIPVAGSTQTITPNNQQKQGLLVKYRDYLAQIQQDLTAMPQ